MCGKADRILKLISAGRAGLHVPNARRGAQTSTTVQTRALTDISVITCLKAKERGCDADFEREPNGGNQEHNAEGDKVFFHGHLPEF